MKLSAASFEPPDHLTFTFEFAPNLLGFAALMLVLTYFERLGIMMQLQIMLIPFTLYRTLLNCILYCATGFRLMSAISETALVEQCLNLRKD